MTLRGDLSFGIGIPGLFPIHRRLHPPQLYLLCIPFSYEKSKDPLRGGFHLRFN